MSLEGPLSPAKAALYLFVGLVLLFLILPNFIVVPISFNPIPLLEFPPRGFSLRWYERYLVLPGWLDATWVSFVVAALTTIVAVVVGSFAAYGLVRGSFPGRRLLNSLILFPIIVPMLVTAISLYGLFARIGLNGTVAGFVIGHTALALPFVVTIMAASIRGVDPALEHAARSLGASRLMTLWRVTFPMVLPGVVSAALLSFLVSFDELLIALFISDPFIATLPKKLWDGIRLEIDPTLAAVSTILVAISAVVLLLAGWTRLRLERWQRR